MSTDPRGWQRVLTGQERANLRMEAAGWQVEANLEEINTVLAHLAAAGLAVEQEQRMQTFELLRRIQGRTPVDTGRARNSWHVVLPNQSDSYQYADNRGHPFDGTLQEGQTGSFETLVGSNVEYMIALETGHSKQAPSGMVSVTLAELTAAIEARLQAALDAATGQSGG